MRARLGLDELEGGPHGVRRRVGRAAQQGVGLAHLHQHGAEVVRLLQRGGAILDAHLALAQGDHGLDHLAEALVVLGVDDLKALDVEAALGGSGLDLVCVADEDGGEEAAGLQPRGAFEDAGVRALGVDYLARVFLEYLNKVLKHYATASI